MKHKLIKINHKKNLNTTNYKIIQIKFKTAISKKSF